jgi:hypothetical protein
MKELTEDLEATRLASGLLADSVGFVTDLLNWVEKCYRDLTHDTTYTSKEVWEMLLESLEQIFAELYAVRSPMVDAGLLLWGSLQAWKIQERYRKNKFQDDPALTGIFVRRILLKGPDASIAQ